MGMFDTFYGKIKCPHCGEIHNFEEQTKGYECIMADFMLGDYIDKGNTTYDYEFEAYCMKEWDSNKLSKPFNAHILIVNGQIVKFANDNEMKNININNLKNIEDGLGHKLEYQDRCNKGIGFNNEVWNFGITRFENEKSNWNEHPKKIGDRLIALNNDWLITGVFKEVFVENKTNRANGFNKLLYKDNFVYKITSKVGNRIARVEDNNIELFYDNGEKTNYDHNNPNDYFTQYSCELQKISSK